MRKYINAKELKDFFMKAGIDESIIDKVSNIKYKDIEFVVVHNDR